MSPTTDQERQLYAAGYRRIAGVDEAGRGCWAGPVVAAAVVLPAALLDDPAPLAGVDDSKKLSGGERAALYERVLAHVIDSHGILEATRLAMQIALLRLHQPADALLIDAVQLRGWPCPQRAIIRGDALCLSIAAASIVAKVSRDRLMAAFARQQPDYGFALHKGYGTAVHYRALRAHGPSAQHRQSFRPLAEFLLTGRWPARHDERA